METVTVELRVSCPGLAEEDLAALAGDLREAVWATDVEGVQLARIGPAPTGAKSGELFEMGALVVTLTTKVMERLVAVVSSWLSRQPSDVEVEIDGHRFHGQVTRAQRDDLLAAFLRRVDSTP